MFQCSFSNYWNANQELLSNGEHHDYSVVCLSFLCFSLLSTQEGPKLVKKIKGVFRFNIKNASGKEAWWIVDAKNGDGSLKFLGSGK